MTEKTTITAKVSPNDEIEGRVGRISFEIMTGDAKITLSYYNLTFYSPNAWDRMIDGYMGDNNTHIKRCGQNVIFKVLTGDAETKLVLPMHICENAFKKIARDVEVIQNRAELWMRNDSTEVNIRDDHNIEFIFRGLDSFPMPTSFNMKINWRKCDWNIEKYEGMEFYICEKVDQEDTIINLDSQYPMNREGLTYSRVRIHSSWILDDPNGVWNSGVWNPNNTSKVEFYNGSQTWPQVSIPRKACILAFRKLYEATMASNES
jgi:hypothetical protein